MRYLGVLPHTGKREAMLLAGDLVARLEARKARVWLDADTAEALGRPDLVGNLTELDAGIVLGGDGAFLRAGRRLAEAGVPMLGINLGRLGFLTEIEPDAIDDGLDRLLSGEFTIEERMMLSAELRNADQQKVSHHAINDVVVARGTLARTIHSRVFIGDSSIGTYSGDGMIVATPTGSTAYSLSAGGPIVHPEVGAMIVTPICPHTLGARSIVTPVTHTIRMQFDARATDELLLTIDGQFADGIGPGDEVIVRASDRRASLIRLSSGSFYDVLQDRLTRQFVSDAPFAGRERE